METHTSLKIWRVSYTVNFHSSSGMQKYTKPKKHENVYVVAYDSLSSVADVIRSKLSLQEELIAPQSGECLGPVIV